uniref:Gene, IS3-like element n=1 Tax=Thermus aquaticus TaxID=271 RepID=Q56241_THEAQ|nr:unnamed protein product [Thermus aquaticus]
MDQESSTRRVIKRSTGSVESQTFFQFGRGKRVFESTGGIPKKAQSKSTRKGVVLKAERFLIIDELRKKHPLAWLLQIGEVSKAGYYKWHKCRSKRALRLEEDLLLKEHLLAIHKIHPYFGYKRMTRALSREGMMVNHKRVRRLMRELGIQSVIQKKRPFYGRRGSVVFPNVLNREFCAGHPFQKLVTDITYVCVWEMRLLTCLRF